MAHRLRVIVSGYAGLLPSGGVAWDYLQYPLTLQAMGHDVLYLEDTQVWPIYQASGGSDCTPNVRWLAETMAAFGLHDRWAYRDEPSRTWHGQSESAVSQFVAQADVLINVSCALPLRAEYARVPIRVLIDSDPMFTQLQHLRADGFTPGAHGLRDTIAQHTHHFTFGESIGRADCRIPDDGVCWRTTRQPIALDRWRSSAPPSAGAPFTTVMNWSAAKALEWEGDTWGQKDRELLKVLALPQRVPAAGLTLAIGQTGGETFPRAALEAHGWQIADPAVCAATPAQYQSFIAHSIGEFSVAKETYVKARTGWFSCRSACYLAAGRAVVTQDTGWSDHLPTGHGLMAFTTLAEAATAVEAILRDPQAHGRHARELATAHFDGVQILRDLLEATGA